jgi:hypothetical protein
MEAGQELIRQKLEDLEATLSASNNSWNPWELEFIENICEKLSQKNITMSSKQYEKVNDLWERI